MDVNDIACLGFGSWSTVNAAVTLGYGSVITITIEGRCATIGPKGLNADSTRTIQRVLNRQDTPADIVYVFEETEVS